MPTVDYWNGGTVGTTSVLIWNDWCSTATTCTTTSNELIWSNWSQTASTSTSMMWTYDNAAWTTWNTGYVESQEQRADRLRADEAHRQQMREQQQRERQLAVERATELLVSLLSEEQLATLEAHNYFDVVGSKGNRYRIRNGGQSGNVDLMGEDNVREASYCAHPPGYLPDPDAHVAQMLTLVTDEDAFVRTANVHYRRTRPVPRDSTADATRINEALAADMRDRIAPIVA